MWRALVWCAAACAVCAVARCAPPAPNRRPDNNESKMLPEDTITIRRLPSTYYYPFSLWPLPKYRSPDSKQTVIQRLNSLQRLKNLRFGFNKR